MKKVLILSIMIILLTTSCGKKEAVCQDFTGGGYNLLFETNGGDSIPSMNVCIACSPSSYPEVPTPKKKGYKFEGWYYDIELTIKVDATYTYQINPVLKYNENNCHTGYEDVTIYAKWSKKK